MYLVIGLLAAMENIVPPVPADAAVALGAFLSHRGVTTPILVFLVTWVANVGGAIGVYFAARHFGRRFFATAAGRRLLAPEAIGVIEREYLRFGVLGIFFARFLPGIRAVVPPFAGIANLTPRRAIIPIAAASAVWYGGLTIAASVIGAEWSQISGLISGVNRTFGVLALAVVAGGLFLFYRRRRKQRRERVWYAVRRAFGADAPGGGVTGGGVAGGDAGGIAGAGGEGNLAADVGPKSAALLVLELAYADEALTPADRALVESHLRERWGLDLPKEPAPAVPEQEAKTRFSRYRERIVTEFGRRERLALVERMWQAAFSEGPIGVHEDRLMQRAGELLGLSGADLAELRDRRREAAAQP